MEANRLKELVDNKSLSTRKQDKEKLIELINYYESCLDKVTVLQNTTEELYHKSNQHQQEITQIHNFYNEFFVIPLSLKKVIMKKIII